MSKLFIVANLKSNKNENEAKTWLEAFKKITLSQEIISDKEVIISPSFIHLNLFRDFILQNNLPVKLAAQNSSLFGDGPYTGEVNAKQIKDYADYVLVGHSERRSNFNESEELFFKKTDIAIAQGLNCIYCVQGKDSKIPAGIKLIAYEPVFAIGSGNPDTPENADTIAKNYLDINNSYLVLYGGSVTSQNVASFTKKENIKGVLVGGASLDPEEFIKIIENA